MLCKGGGARSSCHPGPSPWSPARPVNAASMPDQDGFTSPLGLPASMLGSVHHSQPQQGSAKLLSSQIQLAGSQLALPPDPAVQDPLAYKQLMLQVTPHIASMQHRFCDQTLIDMRYFCADWFVLLILQSCPASNA